MMEFVNFPLQICKVLPIWGVVCGIGKIWNVSNAHKDGLLMIRRNAYLSQMNVKAMTVLMAYALNAIEDMI